MANCKLKIAVLSRCEKEMGIQIAEMEKYKWICSEKLGCDVGKKVYFEWIQKNSKKMRAWLESLSDEELNRRYDAISDRIKNYIEDKRH